MKCPNCGGKKFTSRQYNAKITTVNKKVMKIIKKKLHSVITLCTRQYDTCDSCGYVIMYDKKKVVDNLKENELLPYNDYCICCEKEESDITYGWNGIHGISGQDNIPWEKKIFNFLKE